MKQQPTTRQWDRVATVDRNKFWKKTSIENGNPNRIPTIGEMIEFLGDKWLKLMPDDLPNDKLCDTLLRVVKDQL